MVVQDKDSPFTRILPILLLVMILLAQLGTIAYATDVTDGEIGEIDNSITHQESEIIEISENSDSSDFDDEVYSEETEAIVPTEYYESVVQLLGYILGILLFFLIIVLCKYIYSFFNMFF